MRKGAYYRGLDLGGDCDRSDRHLWLAVLARYHPGARSEACDQRAVTIDSVEREPEHTDDDRTSGRWSSR